LSSPLKKPTIGGVSSGRVTELPPVHSIWYVSYRTPRSSAERMVPRSAERMVPRRGPAVSAGAVSVLDMLLTRRRAVDYCRVATAMCPRPVSARA